jgi:hypothetical protein
MAVSRAIHDRYDGHLRNPFNEIECSDHYSRAMASFGTFLAACGYEYHGPRKRIGFDPRISPGDFRAPFTTAEGWGTYSQQQSGDGMQAELAIRHGHLNLRTVVLRMQGGGTSTAATVLLDGKPVSCSVGREEGRIVIQLDRDVVLAEGRTLSISI